MTRIYIPRDSAARSVGADEVATLVVAVAAMRGLDVEIVRTSSRGALWLEPLIEVGPERIGYGPVTPDDVEGLFDAGLLVGGEHDLRVGPVDTLPWLADQQRVTFVRMGLTDPLSIDDYRVHGGLVGLTRAAALGPDETVAEVLASGLRGRGGAGFPAGIKWRTVLEADSDVKYICVNADEGDSGTFADRMVMEGDPFMLLEGIAIAAGAVGATEALVYVRSEYPDAISTMREAIAVADEWLPCAVRVVVGAGSYVCGEETAMLESLEGKRGMVRPKPPIPALSGLFGKPTLVHNVMTLASVPRILAEGATAYQAIGNERSRGTSVFQLAGNVARGGIVELPFGVTLRDLVMDFGGGTRSGRPVRAVQVGGPLGAYLPHDLLDVPMEYEALAEAGGLLGHGGVVVYDDTVDMAAQARFAMEFCSLESCGKCTPCRIGSTRGVETIDKIVAGVEPAENLLLLHDLCDTMTDGSLCAMGGLTPLPVRSALKHFARDFGLPAEAAASREQV